MVTLNTLQLGHEIACTFDDASGTLDLCIEIEPMPEGRDFLVAVPLGRAEVKAVLGALVIRASGAPGEVHSEGDPVVVIESVLPGDLDGNGIVDIDDARLAETMEQVRMVAANMGRKAPPVGIATSAALSKGELEQTSETGGAWAACPQPLQVTEPGIYEHVRVAVSLHVPAETGVTLMLVARLAEEQ